MVHAFAAAAAVVALVCVCGGGVLVWRGVAWRAVPVVGQGGERCWCVCVCGRGVGELFRGRVCGALCFAIVATNAPRLLFRRAVAARRRCIGFPHVV